MALFRCASGSSGGGATITVTYSSDFYGETVTCSHGTKTYSKVATSSGTLEFSVDEEGTWTISCTIGSDTFTTTADVDLTYDAELVSLPDGETVLPTDDIETWLACAAITDKAYTTLSQVLGDSETYNALLGDSNACAYMARSTTWTTDICADQYAMNLLGQYDTACDALLSDSTWASAIANSTYFESVLNVKVPVMTSATTPSGEVSGDYFQTYYPWNAFDNNAGTIWITRSTGDLIYDFGSGNEVSVNRVDIVPHNYQGSYVKDFTVEVSNDGTNYTPVYTGQHANNNNLESYAVDGSSKYRYIKLNVSSAWTTLTTGDRGAVTVQFYGRTSSSEKIHGGNPTYDSFYRIVDGNNVPVTDPSLLDAGTYTIYSNGLAKDPSNLSNDYGKTIRICPNTKEIVVRPDNSLYWYGYEGADLEDNGISYSNYTARDTIHNAKTIVIQFNATKSYSCVNTKNAVSGDIKFVAVGGSQYAGYEVVATKVMNTPIEGMSSSLTTYSVTATNEYFYFGTWTTGALNVDQTLHALWYE